MKRKISNIFFKNSKGRLVWTITSVSDATGPEANIRNYIEQNQLRNLLKSLSADLKIANACEVGAGYGRMTIVLSEFANSVYGFEREKHLVELASKLNPSIKYIQVKQLTDILNTPSSLKFDFMFTCTVLQHLTDQTCEDVLKAMKDKISDCGYILLIEKTSDIATTLNHTEGSEFISRARNLEHYQKLMFPMILVDHFPRKLEPTYFNSNPGTYMLFKNKSSNAI